MSKNYEALMAILDRYHALNAALALFSFDSDTYAPEGAFELTTKVTSILGKEAFDLLTSKQTIALLNECAKEDLGEVESAMVKQIGIELDRMLSIPSDEYQAYQILCKKSGQKWLEAKQKNDFSIFAPYLKDVIATNKRFATYRKKENGSLYDVVLDDFEGGMNEKTYDEFFDLVRAKIVPLIKKISSLNEPYPEFLTREYDVQKQAEFNDYLAKYIGFDFNTGKISTTEHPYTTSLHNHDVRFTNHYHLNHLDSAIFSTVHEGGHALYEQQIRDDLTLTILGCAMSSGIHESQSRFMENCIGRSAAFWKPLYPKLQATFKEELKDIDVDTFVAGINDARCSLIRIEADELTYPLHIMIRYELEKKMFEEDIDVNELPRLWDDLYESYLGIRPKNVAEGILQDIHWSMGSLGYFPTYALGSAVACQFYHYLKTTNDLESWLENGELDKLKEWLRVNIHQYGAMKNTHQLLVDVTKESFNPNYYVDYLIEKYSKRYHLD